MPEAFVGAEAARVAADIAATARAYSEAQGRGRFAFAPRVLRALKQADYRPDPGPHSGLATTAYLHFTSPIRRYPDLVNHRSLLALIGAADEPASVVDLEIVSEHVSFTERESMKIERTANDIVRAHLLHDRLYGRRGEHPRFPDPDQEFDGEIVGLIASGAFVRFAGIFEGMLPARTLDEHERHHIDEQGLALVGTDSGERVQLGDPIRVRVHSINRAAGKVELRRVRRPRVE
jgi:ribonuclease R